MESREVKFTEEQILMLRLSDEDIAANRVISQEQMDELDFKWLESNN